MICAHLVDDSIVLLIEKCVVFVCQQLCVNIGTCGC
jgi:hypothetical protein